MTSAEGSWTSSLAPDKVLSINLKAAGADSNGLQNLWLPTVDNLRNFFLTPTAEMLSFFQQVREAP